MLFRERTSSCLESLGESPVISDDIRCIFRIIDLTPTAIAQVGMRQLVSDHIFCERFVATRKFMFQYNASGTVPACDGTRQPNRPALTWHAIIKCHAELWVFKEITSNFIGQRS